MLPKNQRIPRNCFPLFSAKTKATSNNLFLLRNIMYDGTASRFCFSVSKKISKNAVVRNRMRRLGYRAIEDFIPKIKKGVLVHLTYRALPKNDQEVFKNIESILTQSNLIK